jgi:DinB family protein
MHRRAQDSACTGLYWSPAAVSKKTVSGPEAARFGMMARPGQEVIRIMTQDELRERLDQLRGAPAEVARLTEGISDGDLRWKPSETSFSILENVCHLRDIEREGHTARIGRILSEERPSLPDIDGERLARERHYNSQPLAPALEAFRLARVESLAKLGGAGPDQLTRSGTLETVGPVTIAELIGRMTEHDAGHVADIVDLRKRIAQRRGSPA